jgi:hypothetical protein
MPEKLNLSKTWSMEYYSVDETDGEVYHSYLGSLRHSELDATPALTELSADSEHELRGPLSQRIELEDTSDLYLMRQIERERGGEAHANITPSSVSTRYMATPTAIQSTMLTSPNIRNV